MLPTKLLFLTVIVSAFGFSSSLDINAIFDIKNLFKLSGMSSPLIQTISGGTQMALEHCKNEFKWNKWNCPESSLKRNQDQFTKETAYLTAIVSSGILHAITKNCSRGDIKACKCHPKPQSLMKESLLQTVEILGKSKVNKEDMENVDWTWGGCSDDTTYGNEFSKYIMSRSNDNTNSNAIIEHHNNRIGRQVIRESMVKKCRCHGVSGSCSLQTCWVQIAPFHVIAAKLKEKYNKAILVDSERFNEERNGTKSELGQLKNNLVYLDQSPNYCLANSTMNWPGTKGRACSRSHSSTSMAEKRSCRNLCRSCGLRVRKKVKKVITKCKCTFAWCCEVKCQSCEELVTEYVCE